MSYTESLKQIIMMPVIAGKELCNWLWNEATVQQILIIIFAYVMSEIAIREFQRKLPIIKRNFKRELREIKNSFKRTQISPVKYDLEKVKKHDRAVKKTI